MDLALSSSSLPPPCCPGKMLGGGLGCEWHRQGWDAGQGLRLTSFAVQAASCPFRHGTRLSREVVESPSLEPFKKCVNVALWDMV